MRIEVIHHHYIHLGGDTTVLAKLDRLEATVTAGFDALAQQVHALTTLVQGIPDKLKALINSSGGGGVPESDLQALADEVAGDIASIQADFQPTVPPAPTDGGTPTA